MSSKEQTLPLSKETFGQLFLLAQIGLTVYLIYEARMFSEQLREMPIVVGVPLTVLLTILLLKERYRRVDRFISKYIASSDLQKSVEQANDREGSQLDQDGDQYTRKSVIVSLLWVTILFGLLMAIGYVYGTILFLIAFYRLSAELSWKRTTLYAVIIWGIIVGFQEVFDLLLYRGVLLS